MVWGVVTSVYGSGVRCSHEWCVKVANKSGYQATSRLKSLHTNYLCGGEYRTRGHKLCSHSVDSQHFMEPEGSLPSSQELSTCTYPEPDQSSPQHPILSLRGPSIITPYLWHNNNNNNNNILNPCSIKLNSHLTGQEMSDFLLKPKVDYWVHKGPQLAPVLSHMSPIYIPLHDPHCYSSTYGYVYRVDSCLHTIFSTATS
jgi:hypothetical protein